MMTKTTTKIQEIFVN